MVELICLVVVWLVLNFVDKINNPEERGALIVGAVAIALFVVPIWIAFQSGG